MHRSAPTHHRARRRALRRSWARAVLLLSLCCGPGWTGMGLVAALAAPPAEPVVIGLLGNAADGTGFREALEGARLAGRLPGLPEARGRALEVLAADDGGTSAGVDAAVRLLKAKKALACVLVASSPLLETYAEALRTLRLPCIVVGPWVVDGLRGGAQVWHLGPSLVGQALAAADALRSPLGATSLAIVREPTPVGEALAAALLRNLPRGLPSPEVLNLEPGRAASVMAALRTARPDWTFVAATGGALEEWVSAWATATEPVRCIFPDLARRDRLLAMAPAAWARSLVLGGPDPEGEGRAGEALLSLLEQGGHPHAELSVRAAEAMRRLYAAALLAQGSGPRRLVEALQPEQEQRGLLGSYGFEPPGSVRRFPTRLWRVHAGRFQEWPAGLLPTSACGAPLGLRGPPVLARPARGRLGWLTWGEKPVRTIEEDLKALHLTSGGYDPELDGLVRDELLARAVRIAYQLFRREPDGTPVRGWSWGMVLTTEKPAEVKPSEVWVATVAGDDPDAGGRVTGANTVAIYSTFLRRTMYEQHRLEPPLSVSDKPFLLARGRFGEDKALDLRGQEVQCLIDGLASAIALTLAHEFGHLCGCGHDTEHPTSIMNVVAGAGASWAEAVWIPLHQRNVTTTLGVQGVEK